MDNTTSEKKKPGIFVVVEGLDGSGKTTAVKYLAEELCKQGIEAVTTREPGGTPVAETLGKLIVSEHDEALDPMARLLMVMAGRIQHLKNYVYPALQAGKVVLSDRYIDSMHVYQGYVDGLRPAILMLENMEEMRYLSHRPDITLLLDLPAKLAFERTKKERESDNKMTEGSLEMLETHYKYYHKRMDEANKEAPGSIWCVDASQPLGEVNKFLDSFVGLVKDRMLY